MSDPEREWLRQFEKMLAGDYNSLTVRIPPRIRDALEQRLAADRLARAMDKLRNNVAFLSCNSRCSNEFGSPPPSQP